MSRRYAEDGEGSNLWDYSGSGPSQAAGLWVGCYAAGVVCLSTGCLAQATRLPCSNWNEPHRPDTPCRLALSYLDEDLLMQLQGFHLEKAEAVRQPILLNMAACSLRQGDFHAAIAQCSEVLREQPESAKALFRRGRARRQLGQTDAAQADLEAAYRLQPEDKVIAKELQVGAGGGEWEHDARWVWVQVHQGGGSGAGGWAGWSPRRSWEDLAFSLSADLPES